MNFGSETGNRIAIQEGYVLPFHAYGRHSKRQTELAKVRRGSSRRGHGPKSAAYKAQQSKMKRCAAAWRSALANAMPGVKASKRRGGKGAYRAHMKACLKRR